MHACNVSILVRIFTYIYICFVCMYMYVMYVGMYMCKYVYVCLYVIMYNGFNEC